MPQPYLVPVSPSTSRSTHSSGMSASTSTAVVVPLRLRLIMGSGLLDRLRTIKRRAHGVHPYAPGCPSVAAADPLQCTVAAFSLRKSPLEPHRPRYSRRCAD